MSEEKINKRIQKATLESILGFMLGVGGGLFLGTKIDPEITDYTTKLWPIISLGTLIAGASLTVKGICGYIGLIENLYKKDLYKK